jgi:hypothetical protein
MANDPGGYCNTAKAIVPLRAVNNCDWCGKTHKIGYYWINGKWIARKLYVASIYNRER